MSDPAAFDALYADSRDRLLLQAYALTGDLPAARGAVRDAFIAAWHHWRKVSRLGDREAWVRRHAWSLAQRRHTGRIWHRDKGLDETTRATLDALASLSPNQRRALLLNHLSSTSMESMARELGLTDDAASRELQSATAQFALHRDVPSTSVRIHLESLSGHIAGTRFPRVTIIRRGGTARRRTHTAVGIAACVGALLGAGTLVHQVGGATPALGGVTASAPSATPTGAQAPEPVTHLEVDHLLSAEQVSRALAGREVRTPETSDNTTGTGINTACQPTRFADTAGLAALVRTFEVSGTPRNRVIQSVELSASESAAKKAYAETKRWYSSCRDERAQLISAYELRDMGDEGILLMLNTWDDPVQTWTFSVVRTGNVVTTVSRRTTSRTRPSAGPWVGLTAEAVRGVCAHQAAGACPGTKPTAKRIAPPSGANATGLLQVIDLPPVRGIERPWVGTDPVRPKTNNAATVCDEANFNAGAVKSALTRSFVIPQAKLSNSFGLTETLGEFASPGRARGFMRVLEDRMAACEDEDPAAQVTKVDDSSNDARDVRIWRVTIEISENREVRFEMALVRRGNYVAQLGFVRDGSSAISDADFRALAMRASARIGTIAD